MPKAQTYRMTQQRRVILVSFRKLPVDDLALVSVDRRCAAVIMATAVWRSRAVRIHAANFRVRAAHPCRLRTAGCCQNGIRIVLGELVHDRVQPAELELALCKLYRVTGKRLYLDMAKKFLDRSEVRSHLQKVGCK